MLLITVLHAVHAVTVHADSMHTTNGAGTVVLPGQCSHPASR